MKYVIHGFREFSKVQQKGTNPTISLPACYKDVFCLPGWQDISNSVAKLIIGGSSCSGTLVNNTSQNGTPYLLTARHCVDNYPSTC